MNYSHDNISLNFDSWWDGSWKSSDSGSNFRIYKIGDKLRISYASGVTAGDPIYAWAGENDNCALVVDSSGNVGLGCTSPNAAALLHMDSTSKGFLPPRMSTEDRENIDNPPEGLIIYNTTTHTLQCYYYSGWGDV